MKISSMGIEIGNNYIYTLQFADDQVVIVNDQSDMEYMTWKLIDDAKIGASQLSFQKTKYLRIGGASRNLDLEDLGKVKEYHKYKSPGVIFDQTGTDNRDIVNRIIQAIKDIACHNGILRSHLN